MNNLIRTLCFSLIIISSASAQDSVQPGEFIIEPPTLQNLGFEWYINSDDNRNATVKVEYRIADHPLRKIAELIDFQFVRDEVKDSYGKNGNVSVDPEILLKLMFLLFYENVSSERALMKILPE